MGAQATAYGFTLGGAYMWGNTNFFYIPTPRGDKDMEQFFVGASYTAGPFTIGANTFWGTYAGTAGFAYNPVGGVGGRGLYTSTDRRVRASAATPTRSAPTTASRRASTWWPSGCAT